MASTNDLETNLNLNGMRAAIAQAKKSEAEGGIPIGSALVYHDPVTKEDKILGQSHNQRVQKASATLHAEIATLEVAGRLKADVYRNCTIYTTLSPCSMCTGAILLFKIPRVVIGENITFLGGDDLLRAHGVELTILDDINCKEMMTEFIKKHPNEWNEDIGEKDS
ncbi:cytidine deaminase-like protein [Schizopora paradoxa]|uniref:Cytosine deaminase n=1 Tax=Schizopora paradoxa TaxID=27342 RepID=A0A0H2RWQ5_9AGAM|nr:cytidine deaminase-like protein [Schizopora paradoxa]